MSSTDLHLRQLGAGISRLRNQISLVRRDLDARKAGVRTIYATDYSELHVFLFRTVNRLAVEVGFYPTRPDLARHQLSLALAYLFQSSSHGGPVYLLPPHAFELAATLRAAGERFARAPDLRREAEQFIASMRDEDRELLQSLNGTKTLSLVQLRDLATLVRHRFGEICRRASEHVSATAALERLRGLARADRLSSNSEQILTEAGVDAIEPRSISSDETLEVLRAIVPSGEVGSRYSKLLDAEALLWLREYNRRLPRNMRVVLVTGDRGVHEAAHTLRTRAEFDWPTVDEHVRSAEALLLDLTLQGTADVESKIAWTEETIGVLQDIEEQVQRDVPGGGGSGEFADIRLALFERAGVIWEEHLNVRLSRAAVHEEWLRDGFNVVRGRVSVKSGQELTTGGSAVTMLQDLWRFVWSEEYQMKAAEHDAESLRDLVSQAMRILIVRVVGATDNKETEAVFAERLSTRALADVLREDAETRLCALRFDGEVYGNRMRRILAARGNRKELVGALRNSLLEAGGAAGLGDPEARLFIAFLMSMFDLWKPAYNLALESTAHPGLKRPSEGLYFAAIAAHQLAVERTPTDLDWLVVAFDLIERAIAARAEEQGTDGRDARFLNERAWIVLQFGREVRRSRALDRFAETAIAKKTIHEVVADLREALDCTDELWLKVDILLPLCVSISYSADGFREARDLLRQLERLLTLDRQQAKIYPENWYRYRYVSGLVDARHASMTRDAAVAESALSTLTQVLGEASLSAYEKGIVESTLEELRAALELPVS
jgi:hypothetical protein